jgi:glycerol-3-phosphate dehydrogenase
MDREVLIGLVERKHQFRTDPNDPVFMLATISEVMLAEARAEIQKIVNDAMNQVSAVHVQAETAARAKADAIVTQAGAWSADQIQQAGERAATRILDELQKLHGEAVVISHRLRWATTAAVVCALAALSASVATVAAIVLG